MKKVIENMWTSRGNFDQLGTLFNAVISTSSDSNIYEEHKDYEAIFEFLEECADVKGYTNTLKRIGRSDFYLHLFIDNFKNPQGDGFKYFENFFRSAIKEDPTFIKNSLDKSNPANLREDFLLKGMISINELYLEATNDNPVYLWEANPGIVKHFQEKGVLNDQNRPDPYKMFMKIVDDSNVSKETLMLSCPISIKTFLKTFENEILKKFVNNEITVTEENSKYFHALVSNNHSLQYLGNKIYSVDKDFIRDFYKKNYSGVRNENPWIFANEHIFVDNFNNFVLNKVKKESELNEEGKKERSFYPSSTAKYLEQYQGDLSADKFVEITRNYLSCMVSSEFGNEGDFYSSMISLTETFYKKLSKSNPDFQKTQLDYILSSSTAQQYLLNYDDGINLPSKNNFKSYKEYLLGESNPAKDSNNKNDVRLTTENLNFFLALTEGKDFSGEVGDKLNKIKEFAIDHLINNFTVESNKEKTLLLITLLYNEDTKEKISPVFSAENGKDNDFMYGIKDIIVPKKSKNGNNFSYVFKLPENALLSSSDYKKRLLNIFLFDEIAKNTLKQIANVTTKNMIAGFENEFTELVEQSPEKFYKLVMKNKSINKTVFEFSEKNNSTIMMHMISTNMNTKGLPDEPEESDNNSVSIKI